MKILILLPAFILLSSCEKNSAGRQTEAKPSPNEEVEENKPVPEGIIKLEGDVTYSLENGEARNHEYPETFEIPSRELREQLKAGDLVKLLFTLTNGNDSQSERMWVIVTGGDSAGYEGTLDNDPVSTDRIKSGLKVTFKPEHVISIFE